LYGKGRGGQLRLIGRPFVLGVRRFFADLNVAPIVTSQDAVKAAIVQEYRISSTLKEK
jgi:hypothetical protein